MARKLGEYFQAGVRLVWLVNPKTQTVHVYTAVDQLVLLKGDQALDDGDVLPGFSLSLFELFARNEP
jgi:Uma2 family endonuclease